jgi:diguanylate cyclase (GGDEF)-like protein
VDFAVLLKDVASVGIALSGESELAAVLDLSLVSALRLTTGDAGAIYLASEEGLEFALVKSKALARRYGEAEVASRFAGRRLPMHGGSLAGYVASTGTPINIPDAYAIPADAPYEFDIQYDRDTQYETHSVLAVPMMDKGGKVIGVLQVLNAKDAAGEIVAFTPEAQEVLTLLAAFTAAAIRNVQLQAYSLNDHLSGAFNRRYIVMRLDEEISRTARTGETLSFVLIDIDHFKQINDQHGHPLGDIVIRTVAQLLLNQSRKYTIVARYGGDEFAILLPSTPKAGAAGYAERMKRIVERYPFPSGPVTLSIGIASMPDDASNRDDLVAAADRALYRAKQEGRNRVGT